ncbi:hypothetical protein [Lysinibacillus sp. BW-2-10]|uniref:hypothetical protein n=1 Tax=Lysinibacillus sp. BW-2-10 TaxID=2590030 RepID=UPI00117E20EF|nr:hypothetical protein [Lysinibacillus sp. BW-2-10]TSI10670.1 hypothetical protein FJQ64_03175 [Lysinibacillus sp. BW-2-10]
MMQNNNGKRYTQSGTDIEEVKRQNAQAGPAQSFGTNPQKVREEIAQEAGPFNQPAAPSQPSKAFSNPMAGVPFATNPQKVREEIAQEAGPFNQPAAPSQPSKAFSNPMAGVPFATNPQKVREEIAQEAGPFNQPAAPSQPSQSFSNPLAGTPSATNPQKVREEIAQEAGPFNSFKNQLNQSISNQSRQFGTNPQKVREEIAQEVGPFTQPFSNQPSAGKTASGTDIEEVRRQNQQAEQGKNKF